MLKVALGHEQINLNMAVNDRAREDIFGIISNQIRDNTPPETSITYKRLIKLGYSDFETKQLIGQCVAV